MNHAGSRPTLVIGLGCQRGCTAAELLGLIADSLNEQRVALADICALASIDIKRSEPGLLELAAHLGLPVAFFSADELAACEPQLSHRSAIAFANSGCHGVAESAALAMAARLGGSPVKLLIQRRSATRATFALAAARTGADS